MVATCSPGRDNPSLAMTSVAPHVVHRMEDAVATILHCVGEDPQREGLRDTPKRVAKAWMDLTRGENQNHTHAFGTAFFHEPQLAECPGGVVLVRDISFSTLSSSTLLPFYGNIHVAYIPSNGVILGLSKLARVTRVLAARLQSQDGLTKEVLRAFAEELDPQGAAVICSATHLGASGRPEGTLTPRISCAAMGSLKAPERLLELEILLGLPMGSALLSHDDSRTPDARGPLIEEEGSFPKSESIDPKRRATMTSAVQTLLSGVVEARNVPDRNVTGVQRYVDWIWHATSGYRMPPEPDGAGADDGAATPSSGSSGVSELMDFDVNPPAIDDVHLHLVSSAVSCVPRHLRSRSEDDETSSNMEEEENACRPVDPGALMASLSRQQHALSEHYLASLLPSPTGASRTSSPPIAASSPLDSLHVSALPFSSECEHHLLPFHGTVGVAIDGPSLIPARVLRHIVDRFARRLQVQERLGNQIADAVWEAAPGAKACIVVVRSAHMCMVARGVEQHASSTMTTAPRGEFVGDAQGRLKALRALLHALQ